MSKSHCERKSNFNGSQTAEYSDRNAVLQNITDLTKREKNPAEMRRYNDTELGHVKIDLLLHRNFENFENLKVSTSSDKQCTSCKKRYPFRYFSSFCHVVISNRYRRPRRTKSSKLKRVGFAACARCRHLKNTRVSVCPVCSTSNRRGQRFPSCRCSAEIASDFSQEEWFCLASKRDF